MSEKKESRNRKISRVPSAHFPPFETVDKSIDEQMLAAQSIMEKGVYPGEEHDPVNHPSHYNQFGIECLDAIEASMSPEEFKGYLKANTLKYLWRYKYKGKPLEDLKKGQFYLNLLIKKVEQNGV
jgi:hypothetical protein